ncbi:MAG: LCP family protein, partial [Cylindrospermopsis raciborskii 1523720]|uniref:LCP family protein n=1 Tax=Cylindrospermopsis raciborskii TaxID=77022 RepID=UPI002B45EC4F
KLIDALGGITVYVPKDMKYQDDSQHLYINLKAGKQHLSGDQTLQLLRFRHDALGDIGRIQRQQMVLRTLFEQSVNGATLTRFPQILETIKDYIDTNLSIEELIALLGFGTGTDKSNIEMLMLPGRLSKNKKRKYGASYWIPDKKAIEKLAVKNFGLGGSWMDTQETIDPSRLRIAIQDSTGEGQSVRGLINRLQEAGYVNVSRVSRGAGEPLETTHIVAQQGDSNSAESVRQILGFGEVRVESTGSIGSDITIQVGRDWLRKSQEF